MSHHDHDALARSPKGALLVVAPNGDHIQIPLSSNDGDVAQVSAADPLGIVFGPQTGGSGVNVANNASDASHKATGIFAIRIA